MNITRDVRDLLRATGGGHVERTASGIDRRTRRNGIAARVDRTMRALAAEGLATLPAAPGPWRLTREGEAAAGGAS